MARQRLLAVAVAVVAVAGASSACGSGRSKSKTSVATTVTTAAAIPAAPATSTTAAASPQTSPAPPTTSAPRTTAPPSPQPAPAANPCTVPAQAPPGGTVSANFPTALAFAPDGRLFFTERSGTVRVYQGGAARVFATVSTVTTEPGGGYSERGLLGIAVSPTFAQDRFVYAFYSSSDRVHQYVVRWADCGGVGTNPVTCAAQDQCHVAGACNAATGTCTNPVKADGASCNDGNACTQTDTWRSAPTASST